MCVTLLHYISLYIQIPLALHSNKKVTVHFLLLIWELTAEI